MATTINAELAELAEMLDAAPLAARSTGSALTVVRDMVLIQ